MTTYHVFIRHAKTNARGAAQTWIDWGFSNSFIDATDFARTLEHEFNSAFAKDKTINGLRIVGPEGTWTKTEAGKRWLFEESK